MVAAADVLAVDGASVREDDVGHGGGRRCRVPGAGGAEPVARVPRLAGLVDGGKPEAVGGVAGHRAGGVAEDRGGRGGGWEDRDLLGDGVGGRRGDVEPVGETGAD